MSLYASEIAIEGSKPSASIVKASRDNVISSDQRARAVYGGDCSVAALLTFQNRRRCADTEKSGEGLSGCVGGLETSGWESKILSTCARGARGGNTWPLVAEGGERKGGLRD